MCVDCERRLPAPLSVALAALSRAALLLGGDIERLDGGPPANQQAIRSFVMEFTEKDADRELRLVPGDVARVRLPETRTAGYRWTVDVIGTACRVLECVTPSPEDPVGAPRSRVWEIIADSTGTARLEFSYSRPWERTAQRIVCFTFRVDGR